MTVEISPEGPRPLTADEFSETEYEPGDPTDWSPEPENPSEAIDQLADRVTTLEGASPGGGTNTAVLILHQTVASNLSSSPASQVVGWDIIRNDLDFYEVDVLTTGIITIFESGTYLVHYHADANAASAVDFLWVQAIPTTPVPEGLNANPTSFFFGQDVVNTIDISFPIHVDGGGDDGIRFDVIWDATSATAENGVISVVRIAD